MNKIILALLATTVIACGPPPPGAMPPAGKPTADQPATVTGAQACDPIACSDFCYYAAGCTAPEDPTTEACEAKCNARCGNASFDDADARLMACVTERATVDVVCRPTKQCCAAEYTSELCTEVVQDE